MQLDVSDRGRLVQAIAAAFTSLDLELLLMSRFQTPYRNIASDQLPDVHRSMKLVQHFDMRNEAEQLVAAVRDARPRVAAFVELAEKVGLVQPPDDAALQALIKPGRPGDAGRDPAAFRTALAQREDTICRIVVGGKRYGTGTLVGPDLVLTNRHVVSSVLHDDGGFTDKVICEFDYRQAASGYTTPATRVAATAMIASSPHAPEDLTGAENKSKAHLDYAVLRLERDLAAAPIVDGGHPRGFTRIPQTPPGPAEKQGIVILQHPNAQTMRIDLGAVTWLGETRLRHSASTLSGSSGAPLLDVDLAFVALHHAGYDWPKVDSAINQAIPMALIAADARGQGVGI